MVVMLPVVAAPYVLAVDDNGEARELLNQQLTSQGYDVMLAGSASEALGAMKDRVPDIMIVDLVMPGVSGSELIVNIKSRRHWRHLPIVVVTGAELDQAQREALERFNIPVLAKPWRRGDLLHCLEQALIGKEYARRQERLLRHRR